MLNWNGNSNMRLARCFARLWDPGCVGVERSRYFWEGKGEHRNQSEDGTTGGSTGQPGDQPPGKAASWEFPAKSPRATG